MLYAYIDCSNLKGMLCFEDEIHLGGSSLTTGMKCDAKSRGLVYLESLAFFLIYDF